MRLMSSLRHLMACACVVAAAVAAPAAHAGTYAQTKYPIVLVHGFIGFGYEVLVNLRSKDDRDRASPFGHIDRVACAVCIVDHFSKVLASPAHCNFVHVRIVQVKSCGCRAVPTNGSFRSRRPRSASNGRLRSAGRSTAAEKGCPGVLGAGSA